MGSEYSPLIEANIKVLGAHVSTKGSNAENVVNPSGKYMDEWSSRFGHGSVYGFLEPQSIHKAKDRHVECEHYIQTWVKESQREVYLGTYLNQ